MRKLLVTLSTAALVLAPLTAANAGSDYHVSATLSHSSIEKGDSVKVSGKVTGGPVKGQKVYLTAYEGQDSSDTGTFVDFGTATLSSSGSFSKTIKPKTGGTFFLHIKKKSSGSHASYLKHKTLRVYRWTAAINVYSFDSVGNVDWNTGESIDGTSYDHDFTIAQSSTAVFWTGDRRCDQFRTFLGVSDASTAGAQAQLNFTSNSSPAGKVLTQGEPAKHITRDIGNDDTDIHVAFSSDPTGINRVVLGDPQVHCPIS